MHISTSFVFIAIFIASAAAAPLPLTDSGLSSRETFDGDLEVRESYNEDELFTRADKFEARDVDDYSLLARDGPEFQSLFARGEKNRKNTEASSQKPKKDSKEPKTKEKDKAQGKATKQNQAAKGKDLPGNSAQKDKKEKEKLTALDKKQTSGGKAPSGGNRAATQTKVEEKEKLTAPDKKQTNGGKVPSGGNRVVTQEKEKEKEKEKESLTALDRQASGGKLPGGGNRVVTQAKGDREKEKLTAPDKKQASGVKVPGGSNHVLPQAKSEKVGVSDAAQDVAKDHATKGKGAADDRKMKPEGTNKLRASSEMSSTPVPLAPKIANEKPIRGPQRPNAPPTPPPPPALKLTKGDPIRSPGQAPNAPTPPPPSVLKLTKGNPVRNPGQAPNAPPAPPLPPLKLVKGNPVHFSGANAPETPLTPPALPELKLGRGNPILSPLAPSLEAIKGNPVRGDIEVPGKKDEKKKSGQATTAEAHDAVDLPPKEKVTSNLAEALAVKAKTLKSVDGDKLDRVKDLAVKGLDQVRAPGDAKSEEPSTNDKERVPAEKGVDGAGDVATSEDGKGTSHLMKDQTELNGTGSSLANESAKGSEHSGPGDRDSRQEQGAVRVPENVKSGKEADPAKDDKGEDHMDHIQSLPKDPDQQSLHASEEVKDSGNVSVRQKASAGQQVPGVTVAKESDSHSFERQFRPPRHTKNYRHSPGGFTDEDSFTGLKSTQQGDRNEFWKLPGGGYESNRGTPVRYADHRERQRYRYQEYDDDDDR